VHLPQDGRGASRVLTFGYEERLQSIRHKKNAQHNKDYWTRCQCDKIMGHHTALEAATCKKLPPSKEARGKIMTERQINESEFRKV